jgi:hypothetical protein
MSVNLPCGWSFTRFSFQRPNATAESDDNSVISRSENVSVPIFARSEYFFPVTLAHRFPAACDGIFRNEDRRCRACISVHKSIDIAPVPRVLLRAKNGVNLSDCTQRLSGRGRNHRRDYDRSDSCNGAPKPRGLGERRLPVCRSRQLGGTENWPHS